MKFPFGWFLIALSALFTIGGSAETAAPFDYTVKQATEHEQNVRLPIPAYYETALPPSARPGDLLHARTTDEYLLPPEQQPEDLGLQLKRFVYVSQSALGQIVPATGFILLPYGTPPKGGWPVVVWAHGTSGVGRPCAPSLMKDLYYGWEGLLQWALLGYAVVAPDYAGLGTAARHEYMTAPAQAQDIVNALPAAHAVFPQLGEPWVVVGHSQGGSAAVAVAELENQRRDRGYLGAISVAPVSEVGDWAKSINETKYRGYEAFLAYGIQSVYPQFAYADFLSPAAAALMPVVEKGGWYVSLATFAQGVPAGQMLRADAEKNPYFKKYRELNRLGHQPVFGPLLLVQGLADDTIPTAQTDALFRRLQQQQAAVEYKKYPRLDHDSLVYGSFRDQLRWVQDRFAAREGR